MIVGENSRADMNVNFTRERKLKSLRPSGATEYLRRAMSAMVGTVQDREGCRESP
jgi:predicted membrane GTPase involved in stress response